jgi:KDO2-lipid IV(A) lauroyltransferase
MRFFLFKFLLVVTSSLPLKTVHWLGHMIGRLAWLANTRARQVVETNISLCFPKLNSREHASLVQETLVESGKVILEAGKIWRSEADDVLAFVQPSKDEYLIDEARRQNRGVILAVPHCGNWEIVNLYFARHYALTSMYTARRRPRIDQLIRNARQRTGATLVPPVRSGIRAMSEALKGRELVGITPDQSPAGHGEFSDFFGRPCYTMTLLPKLANRTNAVVLFAMAKRLPDSSGFQLVLRQLDRDIARLQLPEALQAMNKATESLIREVPEQYWWIYKRFKKQPEGVPSLY